jgi:hypothetical protein
MAFTHTKKVYIESFIKARIRIRIRNRSQTSGSDQKGSDPTGSGSATLVTTYSYTTECKEEKTPYFYEFYFVEAKFSFIYTIN